jgi:hypothetical protein
MTTESRVLIGLVLAHSFSPVSSLAWADGGALRLSERAGPYQIAVFTAPTPLQAGLVDISVFVQDPTSGESVPEAQVMLHVTERATGETLSYRASAAAATNKLFQAAIVSLPDAGWWDVEVVVEGQQGQAQVHFAMEAGRAPPRWVTMWPWFTWPVVPIGLFCLHLFLVRRRSSKPESM